MTDLLQEADRLLALAAAATPGDWYVASYPPVKTRGVDVLARAKLICAVPLTPAFKYNSDESQVRNDVAFIAASHEQAECIRRLVAALKESEAKAWMCHCADPYCQQMLDTHRPEPPKSAPEASHDNPAD